MNAIDAKKKRFAINGIWLFAGEGALYNASPSPQMLNVRNDQSPIPCFLKIPVQF